MPTKLAVPSDNMGISYAGYVIITEAHARRFINRMVEALVCMPGSTLFNKGDRMVYKSFTGASQFGDILTKEEVQQFLAELSFRLSKSNVLTHFDDIGLLEDFLRNGDVIIEMNGNARHVLSSVLWLPTFMKRALADGVSAAAAKERDRIAREQHAAAEKAKRVRAATALLRAEGFSVLQRKNKVIDTKEVSALTSLSGDDA